MGGNRNLKFEAYFEVLYPLYMVDILRTLKVQHMTYTQRRVATCTCILHAFKNITREPIDYSTKSALTGLNGVD